MRLRRLFKKILKFKLWKILYHFFYCLKVWANICISRNIYKYSYFDVYTRLLWKRGLIKYFPERNMESRLGYEQIKVHDTNLWVKKDIFRKGELSYLYSEVFYQKNNPHCYEFRSHEIKKGDIVIDAGACEGYFIKYAIQREPDRIIAFEPETKLYEGLERTFRSNSDVLVEKSGLFSKTGVLFFNPDKEYICETSISSDGKGDECKVFSLDDYVESNSINRVDFIKMDIEGAEVEAVLGAKKTIESFMPKLSIAIYHEYDNGSKIMKLLKEFNRNYRIHTKGFYNYSSPSRPFMLYAWINEGK